MKINKDFNKQPMSLLSSASNNSTTDNDKLFYYDSFRDNLESNEFLNSFLIPKFYKIEKKLKISN